MAIPRGVCLVVMSIEPLASRFVGYICIVPVDDALFLVAYDIKGIQGGDPILVSLVDQLSRHGFGE